MLIIAANAVTRVIEKFVNVNCWVMGTRFTRPHGAWVSPPQNQFSLSTTLYMHHHEESDRGCFYNSVPTFVEMCGTRYSRVGCQEDRRIPQRVVRRQRFDLVNVQSRAAPSVRSAVLGRPTVWSFHARC